LSRGENLQGCWQIEDTATTITLLRFVGLGTKRIRWSVIVFKTNSPEPPVYYRFAIPASPSRDAACGRSVRWSWPLAIRSIGRPPRSLWLCDNNTRRVAVVGCHVTLAEVPCLWLTGRAGNWGSCRQIRWSVYQRTVRTDSWFDDFESEPSASGESGDLLMIVGW